MIGRELVILGMSGNTREAFEMAEAAFHIRAILDDNPALHGTVFEGVPILPLSRIDYFPEAGVVMMIGSERSFAARPAILARLGIARERFIRLIHPSAHVSRFAELGKGVVIHAGVTVTSNAVIGDHAAIMPHSVIHHDVRLGAHCLVGAGVVLAGGVTLGEGCYIGSASSVKNGVSIGAGCLVGMGSNVIRDVPAGQVVAGNPARILRPVGAGAAPG